MDFIETYQHTVQAQGVMALLMLLQVFVADVLGIRSRHTPGTPISADHADPLFRASRVVTNTNESVAIFILATIFCAFSSASPSYTAYAAWLFVSSRALYALFYYGNLQLLRSIIFGVSLLALAFLLVIGLLT